MTEMETNAKRLERLTGITLGTILVAAFVLVQPTIQQANAVGIAGGLPGYDNCNREVPDIDDNISMTSVRSGHIVKTVHAEKEIFNCHLDQGGLDVFADVTTYIEIYENITSKEIIKATAFATTCLFDGYTGGNGATATLIDCESYDIPTSPVPVGTNCEFRHLDDPQEQNMVIKNKTAKTIESQKFVWACYLEGTEKKVDLVVFTDIYENLNTQERTDVQFYQMRCVVLVSDPEDDDSLRDGTVESCIFSSIED